MAIAIVAATVDDTISTDELMQPADFPGSLVDGGCNGGLTGDDVQVLARTHPHHFVNINGVGNSSIEHTHCL